MVILIAAIVAVVLVVTGIGFGTYQAQLWGGKTVPNPADLGVAKSNKTHKLSAADVEASLHQRGFKTTTKQTFSGQPKGSFIDYGSAKAGQRYNTGNNITIIASRGPGVPEGTQGQPVQNVNQTIQSMNVSVHYYKVIVNDNSIKEGTVVATSPADGQPVTDSKQGINVGVAEHTGGSDGANGVGYDVIGTDKAKAQQQYEAAGFNVTMRARFSSKKMLGKIVDSNPKPGSQADGGNLTLYYGIDSSGMNDAVSAEAVYGPNSDMAGAGSDGAVVGAAAPVEGQYCNNAGKCITLGDSIKTTAAPPYDKGVFSSEQPEQQDSASSLSSANQLLFCPSAQQAFCGGNSAGSKEVSDLYGKDLGAFELTPYSSAFGYKCGDKNEVNTGSGPAVCVNGNDSTDSVDLDNPPSMTGASYNMGLLYTYFPVGSDVQKVIDSGYFDKNEVAKATKQKSVDTSRPFFIRRDSSLYDKTKVDISSITDPNPFSPFGLLGKSAMDPVKPAPSDETAYYLVDQPQLDWSQLTEFTLSKDGKTSSTKPTKDATPDQITAAVGKGDFSLIAGKYCMNNGDCIQLDKRGVVSGSEEDMGDSNGQLHLASSTEQWGDEARNTVPDSPYLSLVGPDSDYKCAAGRGFQTCLVNSDAGEAGTEKPINLMYVFKNADTSGWYNTDGEGPSIPSPSFDAGEGPATAAKTDRPYLRALSYHMNSAPSADGVFYLVN